MKTILRFAICSIFLLPLSAPVGAQNTPVIDMEARKASQETLRRHIEMRERRFAELTEEISTLASRTDTRIGELVTLLSGIRDSQQSRHNVSQIKAQAVQGLRRMIDTYRRERREVAERLRTDRSRPMEALNRDIDLIDARIEKRVTDIIELTCWTAPVGISPRTSPKPFDCSTTPPRNATACTLCARISRLVNVGLWKRLRTARGT